MPYIDQRSRDLIDNYIQTPYSGGELQYIIAAHIQKFLEDKPEVRYADLEDVMGALAGAQMEFYREVVAPYEDEKIKQNGPVYDRGKYGNNANY